MYLCLALIIPEIVLVLRSAVDEEDLLVGTRILCGTQVVLVAPIFGLVRQSRAASMVREVVCGLVVRGHTPGLTAAATAAVATAASGGPPSGLLLSGSCVVVPVEDYGIKAKHSARNWSRGTGYIQSLKLFCIYLPEMYYVGLMYKFNIFQV